MYTKVWNVVWKFNLNEIEKTCIDKTSLEPFSPNKRQDRDPYLEVSAYAWEEDNFNSDC